MDIASIGRRVALFCALGGSGFVLQCGARTQLAEPTNPDAADASQQDAKSEGDSGPAADSSAESSLDEGLDIDAPDATVAVCVLKPLGQPVEVLTQPPQDLHTPSMVVLHPGDPATSQLALVALQTVGGSIQLTALTVHEPTASGTAVDAVQPMALGGGMTYGQMVHAPDDLQQLALVWGADGPGNEFRTFDIASWLPGPLVKVSSTGWTPNGLAAGKGVPNTQTGQYDGPGYAMTWQGGTGEASSMVVLSATGEIQVGPLSTSAPVPSEMLESSIAWSGSTYLMATRFNTCAGGDPLCREHAVVVTRLRVKPASNSIEFASSFEVGTAGWSPGYPTLDGSFLVFDEGLSSKDPQVVHVEQLDQDGIPIGPDHGVSSGVHPLARPFIGSTPSGKLVGWAEDGDTALSDLTLGRSKLRMQVLKADLSLDGAPLDLAISRFGSMGQPVVVPLNHPRGVLVAWAAHSLQSTSYAIFAHFLPCGE